MLRIERKQSVPLVPRGCGRTGCPDYLTLADAKDIFSAYSKFHGEMLMKKRPMRLLVCVRCDWSCEHLLARVPWPLIIDTITDSAACVERVGHRRR